MSYIGELAGRGPSAGKARLTEAGGKPEMQGGMAARGCFGARP